MNPGLFQSTGPNPKNQVPIQRLGGERLFNPCEILNTINVIFYILSFISLQNTVWILYLQNISIQMHLMMFCVHMCQVAAILDSASLNFALHHKLCWPFANMPIDSESIRGWSLRPTGYKGTLSFKVTGRSMVGDVLMTAELLYKKQQPEITIP